MRGGAIPPLAWGAVLALLLAGCWVWTGDALQVAEFGFAVVVVWGAAALVRRRSAEALRRGPPPPPRPARPDPVPDISFGAALFGVALATLVFGLAFGRFVIYVGAGLLALAAGRVAVEIRSARRTQLHWEEENPPPSPFDGGRR